jgi:hypothetical protein
MLPAFSRLVRVLFSGFQDSRPPELPATPPHGTPPPSPPAQPTEAETREAARRIFKFWDGETTRGVDPLAVYRKMLAHPTFLHGTHYRLATEGDIEAIGITVGAVRDLFGVREWSFERHGLTEGECLALIGEFFFYLESIKKNSSPKQTLPDSTVPQFSGPPQPTQTASSDFTSTVNEPSFAGGSEY